MKNDVLPLDQEPEPLYSIPKPVLNRVRAACLEEFSSERRGYDPYDTSKGLSPDIWSTKRKRA